MARSAVKIVECQTCGGRYTPTLPDGMQYFHECPPIAGVCVERDDGSRVIVPLKLRRVEAIDPETGAKTVIAEYELPPDVTGRVINEVAIDRQDARNENPHPTARDRAGRAPIISEGLGVAVVADKPIALEGFDGAVQPRTA